ncbi:MAG: ATP-binding protein, partial [Arcobacteraceae bacterium]
MTIVNDYFLLYHGINFVQNAEIQTIEAKINDDTFSIYALILSANRKDADKFLVLESLKKLCAKLYVDVPTNETELHNLQHSVI